MIKTERLPFVILAMLCLITGLWSGLSRIGWNIYILPITAHHGAIMVGGFLGTLISLEKIIPLKKKGLYIIPFFSAISVLFFFLNLPFISFILLIISSAGLSVVFLYYLRIERTSIYTLMLLGSLSWLTGNVLLLTKLFYPLAFPWWVAFPLFIITAERLELMKFLPVSKFNKRIFIALLICFIIGVLFSFHGTGNIISGLALMGVSLWLMRNDLIGITIRKDGLPQFIAISLLAGYIGLFLTGMFFFTFSNQWLAYDAIVHSFFIGFVFSMIFAHGPIILPGVLGISAKPFHKILYLWLLLLHSSWLIRIFADVYMQLELRKISGMISVTAIAGYFITMAVLTISNQRHAKVL